jgi:hypothetical protein
MKVTRRDTGEVFNATVIPGAILKEGGKYALDDPEFPIRNGNQLQEQYYMGAVKLVEDNGRLVPQPTMLSLDQPEEPEEETPSVDEMPAEKKVTFDEPKKVEEKPKKRGWPKGKKRGRKAKASRSDKNQE